MKIIIFIFAVMGISAQALFCQNPITSSDNMKIMAGVPEKVSLVFPTNNYIIDGEELSFLWSFSPTATHYKFDLITDTTAMTTALSIPFLSDTTVTLPIINYKDKAVKLFWSVTAINSEGNSDRSEIWSMEFKPMLVVEKLPEAIKIGPNPLGNELRISTPAELELQKLNIYDLLGGLVYSENINGKNQISIDTKEFPIGELIIKFEKLGKIYISRVIKYSDK